MTGRLIASTQRDEIRTRSDRPVDNWTHCDTMLRRREQAAKGGRASCGIAARRKPWRSIVLSPQKSSLSRVPRTALVW